MQGEGLDDKISETDPQMVGVMPLEARALDEASEGAAAHVRAFVTAAGEVLREREYANMAMLRGFSLLPDLPNFGERYSLNPGAVAAYPMYRGIAKVVGMNVIPTGMTFDDELDTLEDHFDDHDFFFLHYKPADAAGEGWRLCRKGRHVGGTGRGHRAADGYAARRSGCAGGSLHARYSRGGTAGTLFLSSCIPHGRKGRESRNSRSGRARRVL